MNSTSEVRSESQFRVELENKAIRSARRSGWLHGFGLAMLTLAAFRFATHDWQFINWLILSSVAVFTFTGLGAHLFVWMEQMRRKS